jgi:sigma-E factor negative regulatory protein RseA
MDEEAVRASSELIHGPAARGTEDGNNAARNRGDFDAMNEKLSAWMDGELESEDARKLPSQLKRDAELRGGWDCYHLIGDALRGVLGPDLSAKICARLDAEATALAPWWRNTAEKLHRHVLPAVARVAAVFFVAFVGFVALYGVQQDLPPIATIPQPEVKQVAVAAGESANAYLLAHQRYSPSNTMHGVALYVRTLAERRGADFRSSSVLFPQPSHLSTPRIRPSTGLAAAICRRLCTE